MTEERRPPFRRIVVALGASGQGRVVLETSTSLAASLGAELLAIFVEDVNLLRMAALPFTRVVGSGPLSSEVTMTMVERSLRQAAAEARASLEISAGRQRLQWSFRVVRGVPARELSAAAEAEDLLILEQRDVGEGLAGAVDEIRASMLCLRTERPPRPTVVAFHEPGETGRRHLQAAARFALATARQLTVLVPAGGEAEAAEQEATVAVAALGMRPRFRRVTRGDRRLREIACSEPGAVLVLPHQGLPGWADRDSVRAIIRDPRCSVLVLR